MSRRGSAMIETALVLVLFSVLVAGGFRAARSMTLLHEMESAVRAGARAGAHHPLPDPSDPRFRASVVAEVIKLAPRVQPNDVLIETEWLDGALREVRVSIRGYRNVASYPWTGPAGATR